MTISQSIPPGTASFSPDEGGSIVHVDARDENTLIPAISRLVTVTEKVDAAAARQFLGYAESNRISLDHLYAAMSASGSTQACALAVPNPGRTAMVFATRIGRTRAAGRRQMDLISSTIRRACESVAESGVRLAQGLLEPRERVERQTFEAAGFEILATLSYLQRNASVRDRDRAELEWPTDVTLESYRPDIAEAFAEALEQSYVETLDCPRLCGLRTTSDILEGHRATGAFDPALWTLLRIAGAPSAVILLNPASDGESVELVYLGVAANARGRGLGRRLMQHGLMQLSDRSERTISLAVDEQNAPALRLYFRVGFRRLLRRNAMIRVLG